MKVKIIPSIKFFQKNVHINNKKMLEIFLFYKTLSLKTHQQDIAEKQRNASKKACERY